MVGTSTRWLLNGKSWGDIWALGKTIHNLRPDLDVPRLQYSSITTQYGPREMLELLRYIAEHSELRKLAPFLEFIEVSRVSFYEPMGPKMKEGYLGKWASGWDRFLAQNSVLVSMFLYILASVA